MKPDTQDLFPRALRGLVVVVLSIVGCGERESEPAPENEAAMSIPEIQAERERLDATVYAGEVAAQEHEQIFVRLWDAMRLGDAMDLLKTFPFSSLRLGTPKNGPLDGTGIPSLEQATFSQPLRTITQVQFASLVSKFESKGWIVEQSEWHHSRFVPPTDGAPARSVVAFEIHAANKRVERRAILKGNLKVEWSEETGPAGEPVPSALDASDLTILHRKGAPAFSEVLTVEPKTETPGRIPRTTPLILQDLDGDGLSELLLGGCGLVYWNLGGFQFRKADLPGKGIAHPAEAGIMADFTGDGRLDYVAGSQGSGELLLHRGEEGGSLAPESTSILAERLAYLHVLSAGDIDGDGDLDLFVGQWKAPYAEGTMPTPFYDANDGHPDYLLRNDGEGRFTDITVAAGLGEKRGRRTFSGSLVDMNADGHLDLIVVADFSGLDVYWNDGSGKFAESTEAAVDQRHGFGMAHTMGDYNGDGQSDLYMIGMSSTTARRLDHLGLGHPDHGDLTRMRAPMAYGNRLFIAGPGGRRYTHPSYSDSAARTGWSWGCSSADFDLDGDVDIYVSNGHLSGGSVKDYCTRFWCHDLYTGNSEPSATLDSFFQGELGLKLGREFSWNGFEHNVLFVNRGEVGFTNASFLLGSAFEFDSRAVVSDDLDGDGRPDLLVVEYDTKSMAQILHVFRNGLEVERPWIGVRLAEAPHSPGIGARLMIEAGGGRLEKPFITGDSITAQHARAVSHGVPSGTVDRLVVRWPSGETTEISKPAMNQYHVMAHP